MYTTISIVRYVAIGRGKVDYGLDRVYLKKLCPPVTLVSKQILCKKKKKEKD